MQEGSPDIDTSQLETLTQSTRRRVVALQLAIFLGIFGVHRWYLGKPRSALLQVMSCGGFGIWWLFDLYRLGFSPVVDGDGQPLGPPVFRNLGREKQQRIANQIVADESQSQLARFDEQLNASLDEHPEHRPEDIDAPEFHPSNVGERQ